MKKFIKVLEELYSNSRKIDYPLFVTALLISMTGILTLAGGYSSFGAKRILMQIGATLAGTALMFLIASVDYRVIAAKTCIALYAVSALFLLMTLAFGTSQGANKSWLYLPFLPFGIQPSEFVKAAFLITFGEHLHRTGKDINKPKQLAYLLIHAFAYIFLIVLSGDLGVALVYMSIALIMMFTAGLNMWYFAGFLGIAGIASPVLWKFLREDQKQRILTGFNPDLDPLGKGYQPIKSRTSIANGGFFGKGLLGGSVYKTYPASHTDFIFGTFCEKFGFVGAVILIGAFVFLIVRVLKLAKMSENQSGFFICTGFAAMIAVQTAESIGMCLGMLPVVGITLPYMSYGGSSVLAIYIVTGVVQSTAVYRNIYRVTT